MSNTQVKCLQNARYLIVKMTVWRFKKSAIDLTLLFFMFHTIQYPSVPNYSLWVYDNKSINNTDRLHLLQLWNQTILSWARSKLVCCRSAVTSRYEKLVMLVYSYYSWVITLLAGHYSAGHNIRKPSFNIS